MLLNLLESPDLATRRACQFLLCQLSDHLSTISPQAQSTLNITLPFQVDRMWLGWRYLSKKGFACLRTVMAECPQNRAPAGQSRLLCMPTRPSPLLWIIIMRSRPKSRTFWSCTGGEQEEERNRGVSGLHLAFGSMDNLPFAQCQCWHCSLQPTLNRAVEGHLWIWNLVLGIFHHRLWFTVFRPTLSYISAAGMQNILAISTK